MECLKCGSQTRGEQVFCQKCLESAAAAPVRSDVHVVLPQRRTPAARASQPKAQKPEEIIAGLRKSIRRLSTAVALLSVALAIVLGALTFIVYRELSTPEIGENYNTVSTE